MRDCPFNGKPAICDILHLYSSESFLREIYATSILSYSNVESASEIFLFRSNLWYARFLNLFPIFFLFLFLFWYMKVIPDTPSSLLLFSQIRYLT